MYGPANATRFVDRNTVFLNLSSLVEQYPKVMLMPPNNLGAFDSFSFDYQYMLYVTENDSVFLELMKIMIPLYQNTADVYVVIEDRDTWSLEVADSLMKLIQQRYGINGVLIETRDDYLEANDDTFDPYNGIRMMDIDAERYEKLYFNWYVANGGTIPKDE
jgi:hypothetical protein